MALFGMVFNSCSADFLNTYPTSNIVIENAILSITEAQYAINGIYDAMQNYGYYGGYMQIYGDVRADDIQSYGITRTSYNMYIYDHRSIAPNNQQLWNRPFLVIRQACRIIDAIDNDVKDGTQAQRNQIKGHAITLRAMAHFDLVKTHGYPYAKDGGASWGAPIIDHVLDTDEYPLRSTVKETYDFIIAELERAIPMMSTALFNGQYNAYGARALLSRAYLYAENNRRAYDVAKALIEELKQNKTYTLYSNENYMASFALDARLGSESLVELVNSVSDNETWDTLAYMMSWWGYRAMIITKDFLDFMAKDPNDVRNGMYAFHLDGSVEKASLEKYPGPDPYSASRDNNYVLFRLSEVYLIAAEAGVKLNGAERSEALGYLNEIVKRGNPENSVSDTEFTLDRVLDERRKELIGEGHRFFDLLRNGKTIVRGADGLHLDNAPMSIDWNFYPCILPIPADLFIFNPEFQQNPGYTKE